MVDEECGGGPEGDEDKKLERECGGQEGIGKDCRASQNPQRIVELKEEKKKEEYVDTFMRIFIAQFNENVRIVHMTSVIYKLNLIQYALLNPNMVYQKKN